MRIVALLSFYDETDEMLEEAIGSLKGFCDGLVAVDGAYALFPGGRPSSGGHETIRRAAEDAGLELVLHVPETVWVGNECEKRQAMFRLGEDLTVFPHDFYFILDGDFVVSDHLGARQAIEGMREDVASVTLVEGGGISRHPLVFRAYRDISVGPAHHYWKLPDDRWLWHPLHGVPRCDLSSKIIVEHHQSLRPKSRAEAALSYYKTRDRAGIEQLGTRRFSREERLSRRRRRRIRAQRRSP